MFKIQTTNKANIYYVTLNHKKQLGKEIDLSDKLIFQEKNVDDQYRAILIEQPFMPTKFRVLYADSRFHDMGKSMREKETNYDRATVSIFVKNDEILATAVSGNNYHEEHGCERKKLGIVSGQYEICPGCHPDVHSESKAIFSAKEKGVAEKLKGASNYLYNHWWICESCSKKMEEVGVKRVVLSRKWTKEFLEIKEI